jgi:hypothetical protein
MKINSYSTSISYGRHLSHTFVPDIPHFITFVSRSNATEFRMAQGASRAGTGSLAIHPTSCLLEILAEKPSESIPACSRDLLGRLPSKGCAHDGNSDPRPRGEQKPASLG